MIAVDIGGSSMKAGVMDVNRSWRHRERKNVRGAGADLLGQVIQMVRELHAAAPEARRVGVAVPGVVDEAGRVERAVNLGWTGIDLASELEAATGLQCSLMKDSRAAAWAEWRHGSGRGSDDVLFVGVGTGIASAIVSDGHLLSGHAGSGGELGHTLVEREGRRCACGRTGCLETIASGPAIADAANVDGGVPDVLAAIGSGDAVASEAWMRAIEVLGAAVAGAATLLGSERIVIGGGVSLAGERLLAPLRAAVAAAAGPWPVPDPVAAHFGAEAGCAGAAFCILDGATP